MSPLSIFLYGVVGYILMIFATYYTRIKYSYWTGNDGEEIFLSIIWPLHWAVMIPSFMFQRVAKKAGTKPRARRSSDYW